MSSFPSPPRGGFREHSVIWLFGHPRSGTTWLGRLFTDGFGLQMWNEPYLGQVFGFVTQLRRNEPARFEDPTFWMSDLQRPHWRASLNVFLNDVIARQAGPAKGRAGLVIKEPNGTLHASLFAEVMPEARIVFMMRDPRDVIASLLDARKPGSWMAERVTAEFDRDAIVNGSIRRFLRIGEVLDELDEIAGGRCVVVGYEALRADTIGELRRTAACIGLEWVDASVRAAVERHAYERIPDDKKGPGKFVRTARVGGWQEELTGDEQRRIQRKLGPFLAAHGYPPGEG
jgi:hypothetical protein